MNVSVNCLNRHSKQFLSDFLFCGITLQYFPLLRTYFFTFLLLNYKKTKKNCKKLKLCTGKKEKNKKKKIYI